MKNLVRLVGILAVAALATTQARANVVAQDNFNSYGNGDLVTVSGGTWSTYSGATAENVVGGQVVLTGANSADDQIALTGTHTSDALFASFDVTANSAGLGGAYFALFKDSGTTFVSKIFATNVAGQVQFGITSQANNPASGALWGTTFAYGTTHKIVVEFDQTGPWPAITTMWVDPVNMASTSIQAADTPFGTNINIVAFGWRQSNAQQGQQTVDNLLVGTSFGDVVTIPEPSTIMLLGTALLGLLALRRRS